MSLIWRIFGADVDFGVKQIEMMFCTAALLSPPPGSMVICGWLKVHGSIVAARTSWASMECIIATDTRWTWLLVACLMDGGDGGFQLAGSRIDFNCFLDARRCSLQKIAVDTTVTIIQ
eukprot:scaffold5060_cov123-Skeletonema_dohrnii-CCMP3373.AAC.5